MSLGVSSNLIMIGVRGSGDTIPPTQYSGPGINLTHCDTNLKLLKPSSDPVQLGKSASPVIRTRHSSDICNISRHGVAYEVQKTVKLLNIS